MNQPVYTSTPLEDALKEAHRLTDSYIVGTKRVSIRVAALRHLIQAAERNK